MLNLQNNPFAVEAYFESSTILTFAVAKEELERYVPKPLKLDLFDDKWGFLTIAMVDTKDLRPKGLPKIFGNDFFLIGYRIFVRYQTSTGKNLRGLYILKSETNKLKMEFLGNIFTRYAYTTTDIAQKTDGHQVEIKSKKSKFNLLYSRQAEGEMRLPKNTVFPSWKEARRFVGPLPFTFEVDQANNKVLIIEGVRENWIAEPIELRTVNFDFIDSFNFNSIQLSNAFEIRGVPYYWKKGVFDPC